MQSAITKHIQELKLARSELRDLAVAADALGLDRLSASLKSLSFRVYEAANGIADEHGQMVRDAAKSADQASANMINAAIAAAQK